MRGVYTIINEKCAILEEAVVRYKTVVTELHAIARRSRRYRARIAGRYTRRRTDRHKGFIQELKLNLTKPCEEYPYYKMDERYNLTINTTSELRSDSIWGMLRGLETVSQLFYISYDYSEVRIGATQIRDAPYYYHRGLLLDTSRHFISVPNILMTLDAMAMNKMNVFHWHIVDDQSFPYQSDALPDLSDFGAYFPTMVYTRSNIKTIIDYATKRGIRVIPEFDVPGHTSSWGNAYPDLLTQCYDDDLKVVGLGPMHPLRKITYDLLEQLFLELRRTFPEKYFHIGGDEVDWACWLSNPEIREFIVKNKLTSADEVYSIFMQKVIELLGNNTVPIVWQEVYDHGVPLPNNTLVQIWKYEHVDAMTRALMDNMQILVSADWYLDYLMNNFRALYESDPRTQVAPRLLDQSLLQNIVGGEACMWSEKVDDRNVISRVWPRASAVAEVLWSKTNGSISYSVLHRAEEHACRMIRRGVHAEPPAGPGFCIT
ncbi:beta-hexosaminidase subunit beta-like [Pectinophora gossypiella]|uniref:beta-hexosaminidase subunit beta-like n=1 Tax=Pectinophora gossypiella TaxID=13191 RepID=UPI00214F2700|nr:beta-hexosaminidase subunit beta-like [Pectinophora gossypiella]